MVAVKQLYNTELKNSKKWKIFHRLLQNHKGIQKKGRKIDIRKERKLKIFLKLNDFRKPHLFVII